MKVLSILGAALASMVLACGLFAASDKVQPERGAADPQTPPPKPTLPRGTPAEQVEALIKQYEQAMTAFSKLAEAAKTEEDEEKLDLLFPGPDHYATLLVQIAEQNPKDVAALDALLWVARHTRNVPGKTDTPNAKARAALIRDHLKSPKIGPFCLSLTYEEFDAGAVGLLRQVLEQHADKPVQAQAAYALAKLLQRRAGAATFLQKQTDEKQIAAFIKTYGPEAIADVKRSDSDGQKKEAETLLERLTQDKDYAATVITYGDRSVTLGDLAGRDLFGLRHLVPGKPAPEISGEDIEGEPMKLSDFRGQVVLLDFWGHW